MSEWNNTNNDHENKKKRPRAWIFTTCQGHNIGEGEGDEKVDIFLLACIMTSSP